jgi:cell division protein FtsW
MQADRWLYGTTLALCLVGAVMVFSSSAVVAREHFGGAYSFLLKQGIWLALGLAGMFALARMDYRRLKHPAVALTVLSAVLILLVAVFFLDRSHETHRWIRFGPVGIQPSELAKLATILFLAWFLESRVAGRAGEKVAAAAFRRGGIAGRGANSAVAAGHSPRAARPRDVNDLWRALLPALGPVALMSVLIVLQPDLGTAADLFLIAMAMLWVAGLSPLYFAGAVAAAAPAIYLAIVRVPYRLERVMAFLNPQSDPQGSGFQMLQSLIAVGSGGLTGVGRMESRQKLFYLPEAHTDFIFAVLCEELGFIGGMLVLALFVVYAWRGVRAALGASDAFGKLLASGITVMVVGQALINLTVVLGMMPTKGIPLPFVSYGGSSLLVMLLATGVLLNISQHAD